ncbi:MAG TPA: serine hydrolase domain-containing protein [Chloroflexota bacterium]
MAEIHGVCGEKYRAVRDGFEAILDNGKDYGASVAVFIDGKPEVDLYGGYIDEARTRLWQPDTIVNTFSTTKTMTALSMLILADRGELDLNAPVAKYWPEFAANGKADVLVRHVLSHSAGLPGWTEPMTVADICDWDKATTTLARQAPWWKPGSAIGYHAITFGPLLGELVRRITGQTLKAFFASEVARPLGAEYHIGAPPEADQRVSLLIQSAPPRPKGSGGSLADRALYNPYVMPQDSATIMWRRAELGGSNGHGNAHSAALAQQVVACSGEVNGVRLLSEEGVLRALQVEADDMDQIMGMRTRWGLGYGLEGPTINAICGSRFVGHRVAYWGGSGGSIAFNDLDLRMTFAFVMNRHVEHGFTDSRGLDLVAATYDSLRVAA